MALDSERQARSRKARAEEGGKQIAVMLTPAAVAALDRLLAASYAPSVTAAIARALVDADAGADAGRQVSPE